MTWTWSRFGVDRRYPGQVYRLCIMNFLTANHHSSLVWFCLLQTSSCTLPKIAEMIQFDSWSLWFNWVAFCILPEWPAGTADSDVFTPSGWEVEKMVAASKRLHHGEVDTQNHRNLCLTFFFGIKTLDSEGFWGLLMVFLYRHSKWL